MVLNFVSVLIRLHLVAGLPVQGGDIVVIAIMNVLYELFQAGRIAGWRRVAIRVVTLVDDPGSLFGLHPGGLPLRNLRL